MLAQPQIDGRIIDSSTREPLVGVNIFFSKTSMGTTTDENGFYLFRNIPKGRYEMVVSMIGYKMDKANVNLLEEDFLKMDFRLKPEPIKMKEIRVSSKADKQWKKNYNLFKKQFLGTSLNGESCRILNEYVLSFKRDGDVFKAEALQPLEIENRRLGYLLTYYLDDFQIDRKYTKYAGEFFFVEMEPITSRQATKWKKNRKKAYLGSLRHFLATLGKRFDVRFKKTLLGYEEKDNWKSIKGRKSDPLINEGFNILLSKKLKPNEFIANHTLFRLMKNDTLAIGTTIDSELELSFNGKLKIIYNKESEENNYAMDRRKSINSAQTSYLILQKGSVVFDKKGRYFEVYMIEQQGYNAWERVGERLPLEYYPSE